MYSSWQAEAKQEKRPPLPRLQEERGTASPVLWPLLRVHAGATGLCPAGLCQNWSSLGLATGPVVAEHRRSWAGVSVGPLSPVCPGDARGWFYLHGTGGVVSWDQVTLGGSCHASSGHWEGQAAPACPHCQRLLVPWLSRAAAAATAPTAPHPAQMGCTGHPCSDLADLPVLCWCPAQLPDGGRYLWATPTPLPSTLVLQVTFLQDPWDPA